MAKKTVKSASARGKSGKKISVKKIMAEIDKTLAALDKRPDAVARPQPGYHTARAKLSLRAARDAVASACVPGFEIPSD